MARTRYALVGFPPGETDHEAEQAGEDGGHAPAGVPRVRVEVADGQTQPRVGLEPAVRRDHVDAGRPEGVLGREAQHAMVQTARVRSALRTAHDVVPGRSEADN